MRLLGRRIVVTRAAHQADELVQVLLALGAQPIRLPMIAIVSPVNPLPLQNAAEHINDYDWLLFTSANAVEAFAAHLTPHRQIKPKIAAIGVATREAAEQHGFPVTVTPPKYISEALIEAMSAHGLAGSRILIPSAAVTRDIVPPALRARQATVDVIEAYRNITPPEAVENAPKIFRDPLPDWVTFASSSAVDHLVQLVDPNLLAHIKISSIGPVTSATIRKHGLTVTAEAAEQTTSGLANALF